jgi:hypothetical protein
MGPTRGSQIRLVVSEAYRTERLPLMPHYLAVRTDNLPRGMHNGNGNNWPTQQSPFGNPPMSGPQSWSNTSGKGTARSSTEYSAKRS